MKQLLVFFGVSLVFAGTSVASLSVGEMQVLFNSGMDDVETGELEGFESAIEKFETIRDDYPTLPRIRLELGNAYRLNEQGFSAGREFEEALALDLDDEISAERRAGIEKYIDAYTRPKLDVEVGVKVMHNDNVTAGPSDDLVTLWGIDGWRLGEGRKKSDNALLTSIGISYVVPMDDAISWFTSFNFDSTNYSSLEDHDFQLARLYTGLAVKAGEVLLQLPLTADYSLYRGDPYAANIGVNPRATIDLGEGFSLSVLAMVSKRDCPFLWARTGLVYGGGLSLRKDFGKGLVASGGYQRLREDTKLASYSADVDFFYARFMKTWVDFSVNFSPSLSLRECDESLPYLTEPREDKRLTLPVGIEYAVTDGLSFVAEYIRTENRSDDLFEHDQEKVIGGFIFRF